MNDNDRHEQRCTMLRITFAMVIWWLTCGTVLAQETRPAAVGTSMTTLLEMTVPMRDDAYEKAVDSIIANLDQPVAREELRQVISDQHKEAVVRLLARACLLQKEAPKESSAFDAALGKIVAEHWKVSHAGAVPRSGYRIVISDNPETLAENLKRKDVSPNLQPLYNALRNDDARNENLLAEVLIWHSPESMGRRIMSAMEGIFAFEGPEYTTSTSYPMKDVSGYSGTLRPSKEHDVGLVAQAYAGQLLVLTAQSKSTACDALAEWCRREPRSCLYATRDMVSAVVMANSDEAVQVQCVKSLRDCGVSAPAHADAAEDIRGSVTGALSILAMDAKRVAVRARVNCVEGIGDIGDARSTLEKLTKEENEAVSAAARAALSKLPK